MPEDTKEITTLEEAMLRIGELEKKFDEAIDIILKRDEQLLAREREILSLQERLEKYEEGA